MDEHRKQERREEAQRSQTGSAKGPKARTDTAGEQRTAESPNVSQPPVTVKSFLAKLSKGYKVSSTGAGVAIFCFFLPWIFVSCQGQPVGSFSGWDLAAGTTVNGGRSIDGMPSLFLVLLAGFGVLALAFLAVQRGYLTKLDGFGLIGLGAFSLIVMFWIVLGIKSQAAQRGITAPFTIDYEFGFFGATLGYIAVIFGGVINLRELGITLSELGTNLPEFTQLTGSLKRLGSPPTYSSGKEKPPSVLHPPPKGETFHFCPHCGRKVEGGANFCPYCGHDLHPQLPKDRLRKHQPHPEQSGSSSPEDQVRDK